MKKTQTLVLLVSILSALAFATGAQAQSSTAPKDGALEFPSQYDSYPAFLKAVQKPKHVRELFVNPTGSKTAKDSAFPNGTVLVMEIYDVVMDDSGNVVKRPDGNNAKSSLSKVYVMEKGEGWGENAPKNFENGDWIYSAFSPDGKRLNVDYTTCRGCHLPLKDKDFVHRYDEYFQKRN